MSARTTITGAVLGVLPGATLDARVTVEQPLHTGRDTWTGTVDGLAERIADAIETGKDTQPGESTPLHTSSYFENPGVPTPEERGTYCPHGVMVAGLASDNVFMVVDPWPCDRPGCTREQFERVRAEADAELARPTPTISARDARTAVLVSIARALREQPTGARLLDGLDELGEAVVCEDAREIAAWADALARLAHIDDDLGITAAQAPPARTVYRAEHETIHVGHYTTEAAARRHCEALISNEYPADTALFFDWMGDEDDPEGARELVVQSAQEDALPTGYVVVPLDVADAYDPDAE
ncbi:hypothetical protein [Streptomyces sp. NPDC007094]|uniref:hypothetical protein n=1 Tax=Streptomyces sp. NPDC007094 TaxID=3155359 RepID=UPI0034109F37